MYNIIGNIGYITIKWHPIYEYSLWIDDRCMSEHPTLINAIKEIAESYSNAIDNTEHETEEQAQEKDKLKGADFVKKLLEEEGWTVRVLEDVIEACWGTPNGGQFYLNLNIECPISDLEEQTSDFDVTEYVKEWLNSDSCHCTVYDLVEDGDAIAHELRKINNMI